MQLSFHKFSQNPTYDKTIFIFLTKLFKMWNSKDVDDGASGLWRFESF